MRRLAFAALLLMTAPASSQSTPRPIGWEELKARPQPKAAHRLAYGTDPLQFADLYLPKGRGPHRTLILIHGGCWRSSVAGADLMSHAAAALAARGYAVWNVEYRGADRPGGGYPGTFADVAAAADALRVQAPKHRLNLNRVVAVGHSAGGHLALWLAARRKLPAQSPLGTADPLPIAAVVAQGPIPDLAAAAAGAPNGCGVKSIDLLVGAGKPFSETSPAELLPLGPPQTLVTGSLDRIAPTALSRAYAERAAGAGETVSVVEVPHQGHFDLIAPETPAFAAVVEAVDRAFNSERLMRLGRLYGKMRDQPKESPDALPAHPRRCRHRDDGHGQDAERGTTHLSQ